MAPVRPFPAAPLAVRLLPALALVLPPLVAAAGRADVEPPWALVEPRPAIALRPERLTELEGLACGECHQDIVAEWAGTAHAISWRDEVYQAAIAERKNPGLCASCHIPEPLIEGDSAARASAREDARHLGIDCDACHLGEDGVQVGPHGRPTDAHATRASALLAAPGSTELCARCHGSNIGPVFGVAKDFEAAGMAERGRSCVGCHMAILESEDPAAPPRRSHSLQTPRDPSFLRRAFEVRLEVAGGTTRVVLANRAGHRVPGLIGRELRFAAELLDASGAVVAKAGRTLDANAHLPVDGEVALELAGTGKSVRLVGDHVDPRAPESPVRFLEEVLE